MSRSNALPRATKGTHTIHCLVNGQPGENLTWIVHAL
jgi:hypothetical protein